jgi:hypothetical protein
MTNGEVLPKIQFQYRGDPLPNSLPQPDLILAADCVYFEPAFPLLVQTLSDLVVDQKTEVLFCYKKRRKVGVHHFSLFSLPPHSCIVI